MADPLAFMSYVHSDDEHEGGRLSTFREILSGEVGLLAGIEFPIFQDRNDIHWGQNWRQRLTESLDLTTFFIPIITPRYFQSQACRRELEQFLERERRLGRTDLVLPIYYVTCDQIENPARYTEDPLVRVVADHQYDDWRELRHEPFNAPVIRRRVERLARQIAIVLSAATETRTTPAVGGTPAVAPPTTRREEVRRGPSARRKEPHLLIVGDSEQAHFRTIGEAIADAEPGTRILVLPATYQEGLVVDKPLEIIGERNAQGGVVVEATDRDTIVFAATMGRIVNLTIRQLAGGGIGDFSAVTIAQGRLDLEDCDIVSETFACVSVRGGADPRLRRNRIHDGRNHGVLITEQSLGTFEENDIYRNSLAGVAVRHASNPLLRHNKIHDNTHHGVIFTEQSQGLMEDNDVASNAFPGVAVLQGSAPELRRNKIHSGRQHGVYIAEHSGGILEGNQLIENAYPGLVILHGSNPTVRYNEINRNRDQGVWVDEGGLGELTQNEISDNAVSGVYIFDGGNPKLIGNKIQGNQQHGIQIRDGGLGLIEDNEISRNKINGVLVGRDAEPKILRNRIHGNDGRGIEMADGSRGAVEHNDVRDNAKDRRGLFSR
jgi:F-box protein 11